MLVTTPAFSQAPLGPSGAVPTEPFALTAEYEGDYATAEACEGSPDDFEAIRIGERAVYGVHGPEVVVFLDEYARRMALDYCWQ